MKTTQAIQLAGSAKALSELLGITQSAVSQWGDEVPESRYWQLRVIKPEWFPNTAAHQSDSTPSAASA